MFTKIYYLSQEDIYLKRQLVSFFEGFVYVDKVVSFDAMIKKQHKWYIRTHLLVDSNSKEARKIIFGK